MVITIYHLAWGRNYTSLLLYTNYK